MNEARRGNAGPHRPRMNEQTPIIAPPSPTEDLDRDRLPLPIVHTLADRPLNIWPSDTQADFIIHALDSAAIVAITDPAGQITFVNAHFVAISGYTADELIGNNHRMLRSGHHPRSFFRRMYATITSGRVWRGEICNRRKNGTLYWVHTTIVPHCSADGEIEHYVAIRFDISDRKRMENDLLASRAKLHWAVNIDALTGLSNRRAFTRHLSTWLEQARDDGSSVTLGLIDLDHFKNINDFYGHDAGDATLRAIAERLRRFETPRRAAARLGGDEFAIVFLGETEDNVRRAIDDLLAAIRDPLVWNGLTHRCTASIGYATAPHDGMLESELFKGADLALYHAKAGFRNRAQKFTPAFTQALDRRMAQLNEVEIGLAEDQFHLLYQPMVPVSPDDAPSLEALLRWNHPLYGERTLDHFRDAFEDPETATQIGDFVLARAVEDIGRIMSSGVTFGHVAINLSGLDFHRQSVAYRLDRLLREHDVPRHKVCVEVTEGVFFGKGSENIRRELDRLHEFGFEIALDDFGTGFASLTHLRQVPFDIIKIDRSFTRGITEAGAEATIVHGIIDIVRGLGRRLVAEGVETRDQADILVDMGCDILQGWLFGRPCPVHALPALFKQLETQRL